MILHPPKYPTASSNFDFSLPQLSLLATYKPHKTITSSHIPPVLFAMQVARAAGATPITTSSRNTVLARSAASYAPLYLTSSLHDISFDIEELEGIALDRLKVLKAAESARTTQGTSSLASHDATRTAIRAAERAAGLNIPPLGNPQRDERILKDEASHFLLRLALCKTHEHRNWLLTTEFDLFTARLEGTGAEVALRAIEKANGPVIRLVSVSDLESFRTELDAVARGPGRMKGDSGTRYYTVAFEEVPALVRHRKVFLHKGLAYVPEANILDVVAAQFRAKLSLALVTASKAVGLADGDQRMRPILESIRQHYAIDEHAKKGFDPTLGIERISLNQLSESIPAMPLCMANMMTRLREQHHLRHSARMQLGVFLKGCGLTMDESLRFWKAEFGKGTINAEKFEKTYAYNIRHHYGKEGKRRNLQPFPCHRIIKERPGPGDHNGCPYREFEDSRLRQALRAVDTDANAIAAIVAKAREGNFQTACGMCFAASQPGHHAVSENGLLEYIPTHPNEYFIEARRRRFAPQPDAQMLDDEIDDEDMLMAAAAIESQGSDEITPVKQIQFRSADRSFQQPPANDIAEANPDAVVVPKTPAAKSIERPYETVSVPETPDTRALTNNVKDQVILQNENANADKVNSTKDNATSGSARVPPAEFAPRQCIKTESPH